MSLLCNLSRCQDSALGNCQTRDKLAPSLKALLGAEKTSLGHSLIVTPLGPVASVPRPRSGNGVRSKHDWQGEKLTGAWQVGEPNFTCVTDAYQSVPAAGSGIASPGRFRLEREGDSGYSGILLGEASGGSEL